MGKNKKNKKILLGIGLYSILLLTVYGVIQSGDNSDAGETSNDTWTYTYEIYPENSSSSDYINNGKRGETYGTITSELFGDFTTNLIIKEPVTAMAGCSIGDTYSIELENINSINSTFFGEMEVNGNTGTTPISFFCPSTQELRLSLTSDRLGVKNTYGVIVPTIAANNIFNKQEVSINGISYINGDLNSLDTELDIGIQELNIQTRAQLNLQINKNIETVTRRNTDVITSEGIISSINNNDSKDKYYYYNFENDIGSTIQYYNKSINALDNYPNKGKTVTITKGDFNDGPPEDYKIGVEGKNTIIVKGGNIYINADIFNKDDSTDLLVLVAKKDSDGNGGNIYINPNVTNIDAVIIGDRSILSYDDNYSGNKLILDRKSYPENLSKQLLIYGSLNTKNNIGTGAVIPHGADLYNGSNTLTNNIYDLINLRNFQLTYATGSTTECNGDPTLWVPTNSTSIETYAWAGKSECYNNLINTQVLTLPEYADSEPLTDLRTTNEYTPLVIEYNPNIALLKPFILRNN